MRRSDVAGLKDDSVPDHSVPNVHLEVEVREPAEVGAYHDSNRFFWSAPKRQYRPEDIGWLGDK